MVLRVSDFDQSKFLAAKDLGEVGFKKRFKIKTVTSEEVMKDGNKELKACVWFHNHNKGLLLNKTNLRALGGKFGELMDGWREKVIGLMVVATEVRGKPTNGIRIYIPTPKSGDGYKAPSPPPPQPVQAAPLSAAATPPRQEEPPLDDDDDNFDDDQELNDDIDDVG